jgi:hypothetical protein
VWAGHPGAGGEPGPNAPGLLMISACRTSVDAPPLTSLKPRAIKLIRDLDISEIDKEKIFWNNARTLLKLNSESR